ncbi:MAG TPA: VapE domain-containing protein [Paraburkholderia sp.]|uniref:VapE domain-containing protein n=1 Tax=Paraburkholderia sp. TaxID=1926495 RepID=UPI002B483C43|nr:VapE domain-containing protein [Paraburkholderia sp.]HKR39820.1 VapE domain-containing protein [Paraburkholderia sp.]
MKYGKIYDAGIERKDLAAADVVTVSEDVTVRIIDTIGKNELLQDIPVREYRRADDDELIKVERLSNGHVIGMDFGPGATDDEIESQAGDAHSVLMAKMRERERRKSPEQRAKEAECDVERAAEREQEFEDERVRRVAQENEAADAAAQMRKEPNIVKRAAMLFRAQEIKYPDCKKSMSNGQLITQALMTDQNKKAVLDALFKGERAAPHRDHFKGRIVDHAGKIIDDHYPVFEWVEAFAAGGLKGVNTKGAREVLKEYALADERNDLIDKFKDKLPVWDRTPRMRTKLIEMFEARDTTLNQDFGQYFWLSLYCRVTMPGSLAPIVLSLFGAQGCGKSRFTSHLCQIITGIAESDSIQLNLDGDRIEFLRNITGNSVIAAIGEMTGFTRADLGKIKDFVTRQSDMLHYKFEGTFTQPRQWIAVMDGNKYEGLQRDDTGNRRFYPMFCGQLPDRDGKVDWRQDFVVKQEHWDTFEEEVWQIMAECAHWLAEKGENGKREYEKFVSETVKAVMVFNAIEREHDSGTTRDPDIETYLTDAILAAPKRKITKRDGSGLKGVVISLADLVTEMRRLTGNAKTNHDRIKLAVCARGAVVNPIHNKPALFFAGHDSIDEFEAFVRGDSEFSVDETRDRKSEQKRRDEEF